MDPRIRSDRQSAVPLATERFRYTGDLPTSLQLFEVSTIGSLLSRDCYLLPFVPIDHTGVPYLRPTHTVRIELVDLSTEIALSESHNARYFKT